MGGSQVSWLLGMLIAACALRAYLNHDLLKDLLYAFGSLLLQTNSEVIYCRTSIGYTVIQHVAPCRLK